MSEKNPYPLMAFPSVIGSEQVLYEGMTLRDYFAAAALHGMLSSPHLKEAYAMEKDALASICFSVATAMLKARAASHD